MRSLASACAVCGCLAAAQAGAHVHLNLGATAPEPGAPLQLDGADAFLAPAGYLWPANLRAPWDAYAGLYAVDDLTFTALAATLFYGGPEGMHAAPGADLRLQIVSVEGPARGRFSYWESGRGFVSQTPSVSFATGSAIPVQPVASARSGVEGGVWTIGLTEAAPLDPYGHIHDRAYSMTTEGVYTVGFRPVDFSGIHPAGAVFHLNFGTPDLPVTYAAWCDGHNLDAAARSHALDSDGDGLSLLEEYAWGLSPIQADLRLRPWRFWLADAGTLVAEWRPEPRHAVGVTVIVETASALGVGAVWTEVPSSAITRTAGGTLRASLATGGQPRFMRVRFLPRS